MDGESFMDTNDDLTDLEKVTLFTKGLIKN